MISLMKYDEFGKGMGFKSMRDSFESVPYKNKDLIVRYLKNGTKTYVRASSGKDFFNGERIKGEYVGLTDGEYSWTSALTYYVENYNLRLPVEFEKKVLSVLSPVK